MCGKEQETGLEMTQKLGQIVALMSKTHITMKVPKPATMLLAYFCLYVGSVELLKSFNMLTNLQGDAIKCQYNSSYMFGSYSFRSGTHGIQHLKE